MVVRVMRKTEPNKPLDPEIVRTVAEAIVEIACRQDDARRKREGR